MSESNRYEARAIEFVQDFSESVGELKSFFEKRPVNKAYFEGAGQSSQDRGFLYDFGECLKEQGFGALVGQMELKLMPDKTLPIPSFAKAISSLSEPQLQKLSRFHADMEGGQGKGQGYFPKEFHKIAKYFDTANPNENTAEAGRLIMLLSNMSSAVIRYKKHLKETGKETMDLLELPLVRAEKNKLTRRILSELDCASRATDHLLDNVKNPAFPVTELLHLLQNLNQQKDRFLKVIVTRAEAIREIAGGIFEDGHRSLYSWIQWEIRKKEGVTQLNDAEFNRAMTLFKQEMRSHIHDYEKLSSRVQDSLNAHERVSRFFFYTLGEAEELMQKLLKASIPMEPSLRVYTQKVLVHLKNTRSLHERLLQLERRELDTYPLAITSRLEFLSLEVPRVLARGHQKEVIAMTKAINASYKQIEKRVQKALDKGDQASADSYQYLKRRFSEVVRNATKLVVQRSAVV